MSISRFAEDEFWLIFGAGAYWHDRDLLTAALPEGGAITLTDETRDYSTLLVTGPRSRDLLTSLSDDDFGNNAFPWLSHRPVTVAGVAMTALRVSFTGEMGWELHLPVNQTEAVYDALFAAGAEVNLKPFGMLALDSMRLEKGYRSWKGDLTSDYNMYDCGLGRWVHLSKDSFIGRDALAALKQGPRRQFVTLAIEDAEDGVGFGEAVYLSSVFTDNSRNDIAGLVLSGGYGHRTGTSLALAVLEAGQDAAIGRKLSVEVVGRVRTARIIAHTEASYDKDNLLLKG